MKTAETYVYIKYYFKLLEQIGRYLTVERIRECVAFFFLLLLLLHRTLKQKSSKIKLRQTFALMFVFGARSFFRIESSNGYLRAVFRMDAFSGYLVP